MMGEIERVLERELRKLPVIERLEVKAITDRKFGTLAEVSINLKHDAQQTGAEKEIRHLLGQYAIEHRLSILRA
jgi:hypothetical protein